MASANVLANRANVVGSNGVFVRALRGGGGNAGSTVEAFSLPSLEDDDDTEVLLGDELNVSQVNPGISMSASSAREASEPCNEEDVANKSSEDGKKLRNNASHCHLLAFLNSTHTSIRPGRESAGSRRSRWFVVLVDNKMVTRKAVAKHARKKNPTLSCCDAIK